MQIDATHDPALQSWVPSAIHEGTDFPIQNLPFGRVPPRRIAGAVAHRRGDRRPGAGPACRARAGAMVRGGGGRARAAGGRRPEHVHGRRLRRAPRGACGPVTGARARQPAAAGARLLPAAASGRRAHRALRHRRLHGLLHRHPPCHHGGPPVPAGQPAAAQLPVGTDRLSRPQFVHRGRAATRCGGRWAKPRRADAQQPSFGPSQRLDYEVELGFLDRARQSARTAHRASTARRTTCSA